MQLHPFLTSALDRRAWSTSRLAALSPVNKSSSHGMGRSLRSSGSFEDEKNSFPLPALEISIVEPVA